MSSAYSLDSRRDSEDRSTAQVAAFQAAHDEQVSRAFNLGAAYALVRVFECGCYYTDQHAYESSIPTRKAAPFSTSTSIHDFIRGPCVKQRCADIECPDWWFSEEGKDKYGIKDMDHCNEIMRELEDWEERIQENIANYRAFHDSIKAQLYDVTFKQNLETVAWVLVCPPMWDEKMLHEWCSEVQDVRVWRRRAIDMAFDGAPREHYEFCIDAAWESIEFVRSKVRNQLEPVIQELQKQQDYMTEYAGHSQVPVSPPSPSSPLSPGSVPKTNQPRHMKAEPLLSTPSTWSRSDSDWPEGRALSDSSLQSENEAPPSAELGDTLSQGWEDALEHVNAAESGLLRYSESQASAGAPMPSGLDYPDQPRRVRALSSRTDPSILVVEAPEVSPIESPLPDGPSWDWRSPSKNSAACLRSDTKTKVSPLKRSSAFDPTAPPTPKEWREVFPTAGESSDLGFSAAAYSTVYPNVQLPSTASAALYDAFTSQDRRSRFSSRSLESPAVASGSNPEDDGRLYMDSPGSYLSTSSFDSNLSSRPDSADALLSIFEPRPKIPSRSLNHDTMNIRKRSRDDFEDEAEEIATLYRPKKRVHTLRPAPIAGVPSYSDLRELVGMCVYKMSERNYFEDQINTHSTVGPDRIITTTFILSSVRVKSSPDFDLKVGTPKKSSVSSFSHITWPLPPKAPVNLDGAPSSLSIDITHGRALGRDRKVLKPILPSGMDIDTPTPTAASADTRTVPTPQAVPSLKSIRSVANTYSTKNPASKGEASSSSSSSGQTKDTGKSWKQRFRILKSWRLFTRRRSSNRSGNGIHATGPTIRVSDADQMELREALQARQSSRGKKRNSLKRGLSFWDFSARAGSTMTKLSWKTR